MDLVNYTCHVGVTYLRNFDEWWKEHFPCFMLLICRKGTARLNIHCEQMDITPGCAILLSYDMFPTFKDVSDDFIAQYCVVNRDFAEGVFIGPVGDRFDIFYWNPVARVDLNLDMWLEVVAEVCSTPPEEYHREILSNALSGLFLRALEIWSGLYTDSPRSRRVTQAERVCTDFYNLLFEHYREHRDIAFYADELCITPNYLAIITRKVANESPKQIIDRKVILEIKNLLSDPKLTIAQIADDMNFPDSSYLCRYFRRNTGMAISEFRRL